jgi:hypothetical protein
MDKVFHGQIIAGKIVLEAPVQFAALRNKLNGQRVDVILKKQVRKRSNPANAYYWAVVVKLLAEHCGYEPEEMHDALKWQFLASRIDSALPTVRSSAKLNTAEFSEYVEQCRRLAAEMGIAIPDPGEVSFNEGEAA